MTSRAEADRKRETVHALKAMGLTAEEIVARSGLPYPTVEYYGGLAGRAASRWEPWQDAFLRDHVGDMSDAEIAAEVGKAVSQVERRRKGVLGLRKPQGLRKELDMQTVIRCAEAGMPLSRAASECGFSEAHFERRLKKEGLPTYTDICRKVARDRYRKEAGR